MSGDEGGEGGGEVWVGGEAYIFIYIHIYRRRRKSPIRSKRKNEGGEEEMEEKEEEEKYEWRWRRRRSMSRWRGLVNFITCDPGWQSQWIIAREPSANSSLTNILQLHKYSTDTLQIFYNYTNTLQIHKKCWGNFYLKVSKATDANLKEGGKLIQSKAI